jgi:hypothetical protein
VIPYAYTESIDEAFYNKLNKLSQEEFNKKRVYYKSMGFLLSAVIPALYVILCLFGWMAQGSDWEMAFVLTLITIPVLIVFSLIVLWYRYMHKK